MNGRSLSVVIPTRNRPDRVRNVLASLRLVLREGDEIIVVDSASTTPGYAEAVGSAILLRAPRPGASLARNIGWRAARHELIAFVDDDVEVLDGWRDNLVAALQPDDVHWLTGWIGVPPEQEGVAEPNPVMLVEESFAIDAHRRSNFGASANFAARREALVSVGGFDERFGPGVWVAAAEDQDLFTRLIAAGINGRYDPTVKVVHDQWRTRRESLLLHWRYGLGVGAWLARLLWRSPRRFIWTLRAAMWDDALTSVANAARNGYQTGLVFALLRIAGLLVGFAGRVLRP